MILLALALSTELLVQPVPTKTTEARLHSKRLPLGQWTVSLYNNGSNSVTIAREQIMMSVPFLPILDKETAVQILLDKSSSVWRTISHWLTLASAIAAGANIPVLATKTAVSVIAALELFRHDMDARVPDISRLLVELPPSVTLSPGQGWTGTVWASKIAKARPVTKELK